LSGLLYRNLPVSFRGLDAANRRATFVAATENPVDTHWGREVLLASGADLSRFDQRGPFLDAHDGSTIDNVLGSGTARVVGREVEFTADFDTEGKGARAWGLVERGHIRTVSIGYRVDPKSVRTLRQGEVDGDLVGPANVVGRWELLEVSLVPVPADKEACMRTAMFGEQETHMAESAAATIRAVCPRGLESEAERLIGTPGMTFEAASADLLSLLNTRTASGPSGTTTEPVRPESVTDDVLAESFRRAFGPAGFRNHLAATADIGPGDKRMSSEITDEVLATSLRGAFRAIDPTPVSQETREAETRVALVQVRTTNMPPEIDDAALLAGMRTLTL
jgi:hypothetical protein